GPRAAVAGSSVRDELQQRPVRVAEVEARALPSGRAALHGSELDGDAVRGEMRGGGLDMSWPFEARVAVAGRHRQPRHRVGMDSGPVAIELRVAEAIGPAVALPDQLGAQHVAIEGIGAHPVGDVDDAVVQFELGHDGLWGQTPDLDVDGDRATLVRAPTPPRHQGAGGSSAVPWPPAARRPRCACPARSPDRSQTAGGSRCCTAWPVPRGKYFRSCPATPRCGPCRYSGTTKACRNPGRSRARPPPSS